MSDLGGERASQLIPVLRDLALIADGERGGLIGPDGNVAWLCVPHWDSEPVFAGLMGGPGVYSVTPRGQYTWGGYYEEGSLIWHSRWVTQTGIAESRDALLFPGEAHRAVLLRQVVVRSGQVVLDVDLGIGRPFTRVACDQPSREQGAWDLRAGDIHARWSGAREATGHEIDGYHRLSCTMRLRHGQRRDLVLELSDRPLPGARVDPQVAWGDTEVSWRECMPDMADTLTRRDARRSYAVLRGLTSGTGGMVAAATTSLPERVGGARNYDYRYVWLRDQCYAGIAAAQVGAMSLLDSAVTFVGERLLADGPRTRPTYTTRGGRVPTQSEVDLPGYPGGGHVIGNNARRDFQLDVFGESLLLFAEAAKHDRLDADGWNAAEVAAAAIAARWEEPDAGIWEDDYYRNWAHSRLMCVAGLRRVCEARPSGERVREWTALADRVLADTSARSLHPTGRWQRAPDDERIDASLLVTAVRGVTTPGDPRSTYTIDAIRNTLAQDGFVYRYREHGGPLGEAEGAFLLCGFFMALATHHQGNDAEAIRWFERNLATRGPAGLYAEEYDVGQRQLRGNLPQAFVHAVALETSRALASPAHRVAGLR